MVGREFTPAVLRLDTADHPLIEPDSEVERTLGRIVRREHERRFYIRVTIDWDGLVFPFDFFGRSVKLGIRLSVGNGACRPVVPISMYRLLLDTRRIHVFLATGTTSKQQSRADDISS